MWHMKHMKVSPSEKKKDLHLTCTKKILQNLLVYADRWQQMEGKRAPKYTLLDFRPNFPLFVLQFDDGIRRGTSTRWAVLRWTPFRRVRFCVCWWAFPWANLLYLSYRYEEPSADILWPSLLRRMLSRDIQVAWLFLSLTHLKYACKT